MLAARIAEFTTPMYRDQYGLSRVAGRVLSVVSQMPKLQASEVAERSSSDAPTITRAISVLKAKKFIERGTHPEDGRKVILQVTSAGADAVSKIDRVAEAFEVRLTRGLSNGEMAIFFEILSKIEINMEEIRKNFDWSSIENHLSQGRRNSGRD
jgi:DNA-binding MarR family transcriptional regulator